MREIKHHQSRSRQTGEVVRYMSHFCCFLVPAVFASRSDPTSSKISHWTLSLDSGRYRDLHLNVSMFKI